MRQTLGILSALLFTIACSHQNGHPPATPAQLPPAPWLAGPPLISSEVPRVFLEEWAKAENRTGCAPFAFSSLGLGAGATPRRASFAGGWGVAFDKPGSPGVTADGFDCKDCGRSAFGIAGAGIEAAAPDYKQWEYKMEWEGGSRADYGLEGGVGPGYLAYLTIRGQRCLYNVWSHLGKEHLEYLLMHIRKIDRGE